MKWRLSFGRFLANNKLMMIVSLFLAIALWMVVVSGPANIQDRTIAATVTVDLTNTYAHQSGLRVLGNDTFEVKVNVSGTWSVVSKLDADDIRVRPDLSTVTGAGDVEVPLSVSRNSDVTDYDILSISPRTVTVMCDYWQENVSFKVATDVSALTAEDPTKNQIGEPVLDTTSFPDGKVTLSGPQSVIAKIDTIVARVTDKEVLSDMKQFSVPLVALDKEGDEVDLTYCSVSEVPTGLVSMTVPLWEQRRIEIGYSLENTPKGFEDMGDLLITEPAFLDVLGPSAELDALEKQLVQIGTVDFTMLSTSNDALKFPLVIPSTVRAIDSPEAIIVRLNTENLSEKTISFVPSTKNITFTGAAKSLKISVPQQTFDDIVLVGDADSIDAISSEDIKLEVNVGQSPFIGTRQYVARLIIDGYDDVWAYYGSDADGIRVYVTLA